MHISLNFDPADNLNAEKLIEMADVDMKEIAFTEQPYLVYQHKDAGHPPSPYCSNQYTGKREKNRIAQSCQKPIHESK